MNQDGNPAGELKQLDEIVRNADCILTLIHCENTTSFQIIFADYHATTWNDGPYGYRFIEDVVEWRCFILLIYLLLEILLERKQSFNKVTKSML